MGNYWIYIYFLIVAIAVYFLLLKWQTIITKNIYISISICLVIYLFALVCLADAWYGKESWVAPHWFNDFGEWRFMDKLGHIFTAFTITRFMYKVLKWTGCDFSISVWLGAFIGFAFMCSIEMLDSFSPKYGASLSDVCANMLGALWVVIQLKWMGNIKLMPKFSFHMSPYAVLRPSVLGGTVAEQILKDYNGQTYWYSLPLNVLIKKKFVPAWLQLSVGIGAEVLLAGFENKWEEGGQTHNLTEFDRNTHVYLSLDIDWEILTTKYVWLRRCMFLTNNFKTPLPTVKIGSQEGVSFYWFYF